MGKKGCLISVQNPIEIKIKVQTRKAFLMPESSAWSKRFWPWSKQKFYFINWQIDHGQNCFDHADDSGIREQDDKIQIFI